MVESEIQVVRVADWKRWGWLRHGFSTRAGGVSSAYGGLQLNLGFTGEDDGDAVQENRRRFLDAVGTLGEIATVKQVHGVEIAMAECGGAAGEGDGILTDRGGVMLGVLVADCVPILVADTRLRVVGAFHAGWRGTAAGISSTGIERMRGEFGCRVEDLVAAVGPSIGPCCYGVGEELLGKFSEDLFGEGRRLNLWEANRRQLAQAGVRSVAVIGECTQCSRVKGTRKYFSYRGEVGITGRSMGLIGIVGTVGIVE
jgi:YfiH family protein